MELSKLDVDLSDRTILVTGAASGIGRSCAWTLAGAGARVALVDLNEKGVKEASAELAAAGATVTAYPADTTNAAQVRDVVAAAVTEFDGIDGLVASAGVHRAKALLDVTADEWSDIMRLNLEGAFLPVQEVGRHLTTQNKGGSMVLLGSAAGRGGRALAPHYAASKAGVLSLVKSAAEAFAPLVRVNGVCPGSIWTPMFEGHAAVREQQYGPGAGAAYIDAAKERSLLKRLGSPEEIAIAIAFLLSDLAAFMTGQSINVDGGVNFS